MWRAVGGRAVVGALVAAGMALVAPVAGATITPAISLDQSAGTSAGATTNLGVDLTFSPSSGDSPKDLTLLLPPGLLANAAIDGGACLQTADLTDAACQVGSGVVTANAYGYIPISTPVTFDLVPPPSPGDLAGLAVNSSGTQIGSTAGVVVRPSGDPNGVGVTINFVLPNNLYGTPIAITEIKSTFDGLRYPATCPTPSQSLRIAVSSYADATVHTAAAPLAVTGCSALPFSPVFRVTATRDSADRGATVTTNITQAASESPSRSVVLALPVAALSPNVASVKLLCANLASGTCTPVGSATAASPLYPRPLTGEAYLTGSFTGLTLTIVFPSPFPLTLTGTVDLSADATTFTGLPDIPLTALQVRLNSGRYALFAANCATPSGPASAKLTDQNGDKSATAPARVTLAGCSGTTGGRSGATGGGSGSRPGRHARYRLSGVHFTGLASDHPALSFRLAGRRLTAMTVELPAGLRVGGGSAVRRRVRTSAGGVRSVTVRHGHLVIRLRRAVASTTISIRPGALREDGGLRRRARTHRLRRLSLTVVAGRVRLTAHTPHLGL